MAGAPVVMNSNVHYKLVFNGIAADVPVRQMGHPMRQKMGHPMRQNMGHSMVRQMAPIDPPSSDSPIVGGSNAARFGGGCRRC